MDPRVKTPAAALAQQFAYASRVAGAMARQDAAARAMRDVRARIRALPDSVAAPLDSLGRLGGQLAGVLDLIDGVDAAPSTQAMQAVWTLEARLARLLARWAAVKGQLPPGTSR